MAGGKNAIDQQKANAAKRLELTAKHFILLGAADGALDVITNNLDKIDDDWAEVGGTRSTPNPDRSLRAMEMILTKFRTYLESQQRAALVWGKTP